MTTSSSRTPSVPGLRATRQRAAVAGLLDELADFRSAQEIHEELRRRGEGIGLTTVYRTLQALADADEILDRYEKLDGVAYSVLIPNEKGLENALARRDRFDEVNLFLSASETHNRKNVNRSIEESLSGLERVIERARAEGLRCEGVISVSFGCPYEGEVPPDGATALQDDPRRPVFRGHGPYDYVCVECGTVLAASAAIVLATALVAGLVPALHGTRMELAAAMKEGGAGAGTRRTRLRDGLVVAQVALSVVLLAVAGLFTRSLQRTVAVDPGLRAAGVAHARVELAPHDPLQQGGDLGVAFDGRLQPTPHPGGGQLQHLVAEVARAPLLQCALGLDVVTVLADSLGQLGHAFAARGLGAQDRHPPRGGRPQR